jgi:hypothetical protein
MKAFVVLLLNGLTVRALRSLLAFVVLCVAPAYSYSTGSVISLAVDPLIPGTLYAGTADGGVVKSTNGGATWAPTGLGNTPVLALAIDPGVPSFLYAVTPTGVFKSTSGGDTWTPFLENGSIPYWGIIPRPLSWTFATLTLGRRTDPARPATVYVGVTYAASDAFTYYEWGDVFTGTAGGERWTGFLPDANDPYSSPWMSAPPMGAAAQSDTTPSTVYTSVSPGMYGYQVCWIQDATLLAGCSRLDQSPEGPTVLVSDPRNPYVVYAGMNGTGVYKTTDAGATWVGGGAGAIKSLAIDPRTPGILYAGTDDLGVLKSTDGGVTWSSVNTGLISHLEALGVHLGIKVVAVDPLVPNTIYAGTVAGVFKSTDGGGSWTLTGVTQQSSLVSLGISPAAVTRGETSTGTVTLNSAAPSGGTVVTLSSADAVIATVPPSVTVASGATSASFAISTSQSLVNPITVKISATLQDAARSGLLSVAPPLGSLVLNTNRVAGGIGSTGTVALGLPAGAGSAVVSLSTSNPAVAAVPITVTVAPGATSANFTVSTAAVTATTTVTITAAYGGDTRSTVLELVPTTLSSLSFNPRGPIAGNASTGTVTLSVPAPAGSAVVTLSSSMTSVATVPANVTVAAGAMSASFAISTNPVLPPNVGSAFVRITAANGGAVISDELMVWRPDFALSSLSLDAVSVTGGTVSTARAMLGAAAPAGGALVTLSSSNPSVAAVPGSVMVPAGATSASFTVTTNSVTTSTSVTMSATSGGSTREVQLLVTPSPATSLSSLNLAPTSVTSGAASTGTAILSAPAPAGGAAVALTSSDPGIATVPPTVLVPSGNMSGTFTVSASACTSGSVIVSAAFGGATRSTSLTVTSSADAVSIQQSDYFADNRQLRLAARSSAWGAALSVHVTSSGALIGTLQNLGDGKYSGQFTWSVNPQNITVRSSLCGSAATVVRRR